MTLNADLLPLLRSVTRQVLETMFFSDAEPVDCGHRRECVAARVGFERGNLSIMLSRELAVALSAGFLAEDGGRVTARQLDQVTCELANILCGAILSRVHPRERVALGPPEIALPDFGSGAAAHQCFATPEGMLALTLRLDDKDDHGLENS